MMVMVMVFLMLSRRCGRRWGRGKRGKVSFWRIDAGEHRRGIRGGLERVC